MMKTMKIRAVSLLSAILLLAIVLFAAYDWFSASDMNREMVPRLRDELAAIKLPRADRIINSFSSYKSTHAVVGEAISSSESWQALREFYLSEMQQLGWTHIESKKLLEWNQDRGGEIERFKKDSHVASIYYAETPDSHPWTYTVDISAGLY